MSLRRLEKLADDERRLCEQVNVGKISLPDGLWRLRVEHTKVVATEEELDDHVNIFATPEPNEVLLDRAVVALCEAYRRVTRPERIGQQWGHDRWAHIAQVMAKLRGLAEAALWSLPAPSSNPSSDPKVLASVGLDDPSAAAVAVDNAEGVVDARTLRVAVALSLGRVPDKAAILSQETEGIARINLSNLRSVGLAIERLSSEGESRAVCLSVLKDHYGPLAAGLGCIRQRLADEVDRFMAAMQDSIHAPATAAAQLSVRASHRPEDLLAAAKESRPPTQAKLDPGTDSGGAREQTAGSGAGGEHHLSAPLPPRCSDHFSYLHEATLLSGIASLAEVDSPLLPEPAGMGDTISSEFHGKSNKVTAWHVEFTIAQLHKMRKAVADKTPKVEGAQAVFDRCLDTYERCSDAMRRAYAEERAMRAMPVDVGGHGSLLELVKSLRSSWGDAGAILAPSRQVDLVALERIRLRHKQLVLQTLNTCGQDIAAIVLAKLALLEEMLLPPGKRQLTEEVPLSLLKPFELLREAIQTIAARCEAQERGGGRVSTAGSHSEEDSTAAALPRSRLQRWLRCPHSVANMVLLGEVQRQLLERFQTVDAAFEPILTVCGKARLNMREFRIALSLLELSFNERIVAMLQDATADAGAGDATLEALFDMIQMYGAAGGAQILSRVAVAATATRNLVKPGSFAAVGPASEEAGGSGGDVQEHRRHRRMRGALVQAPPQSGDSQDPSKTHASGSAGSGLHSSPKRPTWACRRCLRGSMPVVPHVSIQDLHRHLSAGSYSSEVSTPGRRGGSSDIHMHMGHGYTSITDLQVAERAQREFGEDAVISWATAVLTQGLLLKDDTRGNYFRWLAHIVLYSAREGGLDFEEPLLSDAPHGGGLESAPPTAPGPPPSAPMMQHHQQHPQSPGTSRSVRGTADRGHRRGPSGTSGRGLSGTTPAGAVGAGLGGKAVGIANQVTKWRSTEAEDDMGDHLDPSLVLPDNTCNALRVDLGLPSEAEMIAGKTKRWDVEDGGKKQTVNLASQRSRRRGRELRLLAALRTLNVPEADVMLLQREFTLVAEVSGPSPSGVILVGGAARVAQGILLKGTTLAHSSLRSRTGKRSLMASEGSDRTMLLSRQTPSTKLDPALDFNEERDRMFPLLPMIDHAESIVKASHFHQQQCYRGAGYDRYAAKVASALRFLEGLIAGEAGSGFFPGSLESRGSSNRTWTAAGKVSNADASMPSVGLPEPVQEVLPQVLPRATASRLIAQAMLEAAEAQADEDMDGLVMKQTPSMKALQVRVQEPSHLRRYRSSTQENRRGSATTDGSIDSDDTHRSPTVRACRRSKSSPALVMLESPCRSSKSKSKPTTPMSHAKRHSRQQAAACDAAKAAAKAADATPTEEPLPIAEQVPATRWPDPVQKLMNSVEQRGDNLRRTTGPKQFAKARLGANARPCKWKTGKKHLVDSGHPSPWVTMSTQQAVATLPPLTELSWRCGMDSTQMASTCGGKWGGRTGRSDPNLRVTTTKLRMELTQ